jgi:hypothetical protein
MVPSRCIGLPQMRKERPASQQQQEHQPQQLQEEQEGLDTSVTDGPDGPATQVHCTCRGSVVWSWKADAQFFELEGNAEGASKEDAAEEY